MPTIQSHDDLIETVRPVRVVDIGHVGDGYQDPTWWLAEGWDGCQAQGREHPLYWQRQGTSWHAFGLHGLHGLLPLEDHALVLHVSYFEADAYARWDNVRLPTEAEWEHAASNKIMTNKPLEHI